MSVFMLILVGGLLLAVLAALAAGLWQMAHEGEGRRKKSNKMMQWRIYLQGALILLLALMALFK